MGSDFAEVVESKRMFRGMDESPDFGYQESD